MFYHILIITIILIIYLIKTRKLDQAFYEQKIIYPELNNIKKDFNKVRQEVINLDEKWIEWPEKYLYDGKDNWTIIPLFVFDKYSSYVEKLPTLYNFLKNIKGLKIASLSKMKPGTKLIPHQGWGDHSNYVLRCHYGIIVEKNKCYISVLNNNIEELKYQEENEWLVFDDSKTHYAENMSCDDRIVLIIDIVRPNYVKVGNSKILYSDEFNNIIKAFKEM